MTTALIRWLFLFLAFLVLSGCSNLPSLDILNRPATEETEFFAQGLDHYIKSRDLSMLKQLPKRYPQGEWRARAEGIIDIAELQQLQQRRLEKKNRELAHTQQEKEVLFEDNKILEVTLERLKQVLIDMELRAE